ncbi:putative RNA-directed DNA polymerase [Tanacetum coccineum]
MSVHNSKHNSLINSDNDDDVHDPVTRIRKIDISDPLHLQPNDTTALTVVSIKLKGTENYQILNSIAEELFLGQIFSKRAKHVWEELKETYDKVDGSIIFGLHNQINTLKQKGSSIVDYYHKLNALWKQYDAMIELPKCVCNASEGFKKHNQLLKLMQFFMGLDDSYMQIRSSILSRETLPDVRSAHATIFSEESHRVAVGSIAGSSQRNQASAFVSNVPNSQNFQRSNQNFSAGPSRPNNLNNNRQGGGSGLNNNRCFKIIGYPADFGKKKSGQNFKKQSVSNNNSVGKSSSSGFTDEQMATLISLIKDNKVGKNMQANMAEANQHMTYTDKELDNVLDISHLKIKVGHPNGTEAYISKIENLILSNGLTVYDVMVIHEYCVTLISVHKLVKEIKVIVAFDEDRCYFLNQDLNLKNVKGIGEQCEGLYYYNDKGIKSNTSTLRFQCMLSQHDWHCRLSQLTNLVLNVLKDSLNIDKKDNTVCCEICQRAKQTRESFPLSDHKFFLTVVDDYTRAVWVYLIKSKDEVPHFITVFYNLIENQFKRKIKVFGSDNDTEFVNQSVTKLCSDKGGIGGIPLRMWYECVLTATYLVNRFPSSVLNGKSPYEMIYKKCHSLSHLRVFGCLCFATLVNSSDKFGSRSEKCVLIGYSSVKKGYRLYSLDKHQFIFSRDVKFFENIFPFKDSDKVKDVTEKVFQDVNHINFFDLEYPETPNDDERVDPKLNCDNKKSQSASSSSSESGGISVTADFPVNSGNDVDSSDNNFATQDEGVTTLEENVFSEGNMDQNPNSISQDNQNLRRSSRQSVFPKNYNDFVVDSTIKYEIEKYVGYSKLNFENYCFITQLNNNFEPKSFSKASKSPHWIDDMNQE